MKMTNEEYEKFMTFMLDKRSFAANRTPEQRDYFNAQVKRRVVTFLGAIGKHDLKNMLAHKFLGETTFYSEIEAWKQAEELGYKEPGFNESPYTWYKILRPTARKLANDAKAFTKHFEKLGE